MNAALETRELEYFLAVADELHFGRAAVRLSVAQPALSKTVRRIENRLGVTLFVRSSRHVELTPAGEALREHGRHALNAVGAAVRHAQKAGAGQNRLRLVLKPGGDGGLLSGMLAAYSEMPDARQVDILFSGPADRAGYLLDGRADVGLLYAPFDPLDGLAHEQLYTEDRVAVIPSGHQLAGRAALRLADLDGEPRPVWKGVPGAGPGLDPRIDPSVKAGGRQGAGNASVVTDPASEVGDIFQLLHLIAAGQMVELLPRSLVPSLPPGVVLIPVTDAPPSRLVLAWNENDRRPLVASFVAAVTGIPHDLRAMRDTHG